MSRGLSNARSTYSKPQKDPIIDIQIIPPESDDSDRNSACEQTWRPISLRTPFLFTTAVFTFGLIALLQVLLVRSQRDEGILFASNVTDLPFEKTFLYLYLPTVISVIYSLVWSWIDLDARRIEPYRQLSKPDGASAEESLLLHYPFDFLGTVPLRSLRRRHWPVFMGSTALVLVSWVIVPLQAAIFATDTVSKASTESGVVSNKYLTTVEQALQVTSNYTYSVFNIAWLNERLPPYMSRDAALAPFQLASPTEERGDESWTGQTMLYGVDVACEPPVLQWQNGTVIDPEHAPSNTGYDEVYYLSTQGCNVPYPYGPTGNDTINNTAGMKEYSALYAGYEDEDGLASYYLTSYCPANASNVFMAIFGQNKHSDSEVAKVPTMLFCEPTYYRQSVTATISRQDLGVMNTTALDGKQPLPVNMFNPKRLEWQMNSAILQKAVRGDIPSSRWPDPQERLAPLPITMNTGENSVMVGMALGSYQRPIQDYLDPAVLQESYQAAYRLLFARYMVDVLKANYSDATPIDGVTTYTTQAVYMVPGFTYAVEGLLAVVGLLALGLLVFQSRQKLALAIDPGSIAALLALSGRESPLMELCRTSASSDGTLQEGKLAGYTFALARIDGAHTLRLLSRAGSQSGNAVLSFRNEDADSGSHKSRGPWELSGWTGTAFTAALLALLTVLTYLFLTARHEGLALPSQNRFVRQLLENYVPIAIATLIEPVWVMLNRLLCVAQPYHRLVNGQTPATEAVKLNYISLPPQMVLLKAALHKHLRLSVVCAMALLANVLAVSFGALFIEDTILRPVPTSFSQLYRTQFHDFSNTTGPWYSASAGEGLDQFYITMSNLTSATPMPAWTDNDRFYVPFGVPMTGNATYQYRANTSAFGATLDCRALRQGNPDSWSLELSQDLTAANLSVIINDTDLGIVNCSGLTTTIGAMSNSNCTQRRIAAEIVTTVGSSRCIGQDERWKNLIVAAWLREQTAGSCEPNTRSVKAVRTVNLTDDEATVIACLPVLSASSAKVAVDAGSIVQDAISVPQPPSALLEYFEDEPEILLRQANDFLINPGGGGGVWHEDLYPSDWNNYLMKHMGNGSSFLDASSQPPPPDFIIPLFSQMYSKVFAVWLGMWHETLLKSAVHGDPPLIGSTLERQTRIRVSRPMFFLAMSILASYTLAVIVLYLTMPRRALPKLPTTLASTLAFFAANPVKDNIAISGRLSKERDHYAKRTIVRGRTGDVDEGFERHSLIDAEESQATPKSGLSKVVGILGLWRR